MTQDGFRPTRSEHARIIRGIFPGMSIASIAKQVGLSQWAVRKALRAGKVGRPRKPRCAHCGGTGKAL